MLIQAQVTWLFCVEGIKKWAEGKGGGWRVEVGGGDGERF
jgi:hypothetical protein